MTQDHLAAASKGSGGADGQELPEPVAFGQLGASNLPLEALYTADQMHAAIEAERAKSAALKTVMIAAAEEIAAHWDAHCDAEGYGPQNLMRRLEEGIPSEYGYTAGRFAEMQDELSTLRGQLEEAVRDARRYRNLRDVSTFTWRSFQEQWRMPADKCDSTVDAHYATLASKGAEPLHDHPAVPRG